MRGKLIVITGVMALGLSACGAQGSDPVGGSSSSEVIGSAEAAVTEESTSDLGTASLGRLRGMFQHCERLLQ